MYREKTSLVPILYYNRLPAEVDSDIAIVLEPMIATGRLCSGGYLMGGGPLTLLVPCVSRHHQRVPDDAEAVGREAHQGALYHRFQAWYARCGRSALVDVLTCIPPFTCPLAGLAALHKAHPDVQVHVAAVDNELNEVGSWCWCRACLVLNLTTCCRRHIRTRTLYPALAMWETACGAPCKAPRQQATPLPRVLAPAMQVLVARSAPVRRKSVVVRAVAYAAVRAK